MPSSPTAVLFDVDGTLVDTNYLHVVAWWQAFRSGGHRVAMTDIHRTVGQGSDRLVESLLGHADDDVAAAHTDYYGPHLRGLVALPGAADLLRAVRDRGARVVLATSASAQEAQHLRAAIDADDAIEVMTTKDDAGASKPAPDIVETALATAKVDADDAIFVGDTVWDVEAARRAGLDCVCLLSGGIGRGELLDAGAVAVYRDAAHLLAELDSSPLAKRLPALR